MISDNINALRQRIARACTAAGRSPSDVTMIAVAKTFSAAVVREAISAGVSDIGENYVQELLRKREELPVAGLRWHYIGHLQSNKVKYIAGWVTMIHAVDSVSLAREVDRQAAKAGRIIDCLIEVNTTQKQTQFGVPPQEAIGFVRSLGDAEHIRFAGLMTIGPFLPDPEGSRPMFRQLRQVRDEIAGIGQQNVQMRHLSMGMTGDFEVAIEEGATMIRIGTAIFGSRTKAAYQRRTP